MAILWRINHLIDNEELVPLGCSAGEFEWSLPLAAAAAAMLRSPQPPAQATSEAAE